MKVFKNTLIAATLLLSITSAQAAFVESDWQNAGDALATLDTETGIEWLDLSVTNSQTLSDVEPILNSTYAGWRLPTTSEVHNLYLSFFPTADQTFSGRQNAQYGPSVTWISLLGAHNDGSHKRSVGYYYRDDGSKNLVGTTILGPQYNSAQSWLDPINSGYKVNENSSNVQYHGTFLVSDGGTTLSSRNDPSMNTNNAAAPINDVSAPALLGLMGLGLFGFAVRRRNAK
jgi:MYXO-CTERM domain-containing protein